MLNLAKYTANINETKLDDTNAFLEPDPKDIKNTDNQIIIVMPMAKLPFVRVLAWIKKSAIPSMPVLFE